MHTLPPASRVMNFIFSVTAGGGTQWEGLRSEGANPTNGLVAILQGLKTASLITCSLFHVVPARKPFSRHSLQNHGPSQYH